MIVGLYYQFIRVLKNKIFLPKCIYSDTNGRIWVGTVSGLFVIDCGSEVFEGGSNCETKFPIIQDEGDLGPFLYGQQVNVITEDGAGRKWIGTNNGIYVTNPSVDEVVLHLTRENSPLSDNNVRVLEIDKEKGIVYIGTSAGIQMYRTDASIGKPYHEASLTIYPNPVRPWAMKVLW
jgi:ligand-binding sensor domain-containing protein